MMEVTNKLLKEYGAEFCTGYVTILCTPIRHKVIDGTFQSVYSADRIRKAIKEKYNNHMSNLSREKMIKITDSILLALERIESETI